jgi:UDPglucose--hexose-1-phosphate uridylyltransferase
VRRTSRRLADGREILYFDLDGAPPREATDRRDLEPVVTASELRHDVLLDEPVAVTTHRQTRTHRPPADQCPLCPSTPDRATEIPEPGYDVAVFENRFPTFAAPPSGAPGRCEVVCFTADHDGAFAALPPAHARLVVDAWADRTRELAALPYVEQVFCFENRGEEIGVTLHHPHGQIYAYPFVTPRTRRVLTSATAHRAAGGGDLLGDMLARERADGSRLVAERLVDDHRGWTAFVPFAARWPLELLVVPHRFVPDLPALDDEERDALAVLLLDLTARLDRLYARPLPYIAAWQQAPVREGRDDLRLHLQLFSIRRAADKLKYLAGSESGMGAFINDVAPEAVAARLRDLAVDGSARLQP